MKYRVVSEPSREGRKPDSREELVLRTGVSFLCPCISPWVCVLHSSSFPRTLILNCQNRIWAPQIPGGTFKNFFKTANYMQNQTIIQQTSHLYHSAVTIINPWPILPHPDPSPHSHPSSCIILKQIPGMTSFHLYVSVYL